MKLRHAVPFCFSIHVMMGCQSEKTAQQETAAARPGPPAEVTPALASKAEQILHDHAGAPYGTEVKFTLGGKDYIARVEPHKDPARGEHKGITVYEVR